MKTIEKIKTAIRCPECGLKQKAFIEQTLPFYTYVHECVNCHYIIGESEWEIVAAQPKKPENPAQDPHK